MIDIEVFRKKPEAFALLGVEMAKLLEETRLKIVVTNRKEWIAALRSGEYKQATGCLEAWKLEGDERVKEGNCCLGVACCVLGVERTGSDGTAVHYHVSFDHMAAELDGRYLQLFGLNYQQHAELIKMNDTDGLSFEAIAEWIEGQKFYVGVTAYPSIKEMENKDTNDEKQRTDGVVDSLETGSGTGCLTSGD